MQNKTKASDAQKCLSCGAIIGKEFCKPGCTCEECSKWDKYVSHLDDLVRTRKNEQS